MALQNLMANTLMKYDGGILKKLFYGFGGNWHGIYETVKKEKAQGCRAVVQQIETTWKAKRIRTVD